MGARGFNELERKCLSCIYGTEDCGRVTCGHPYHSGIIGGCGTEWVKYCSDYCKDMKGGIKQVITITKIVRKHE